MRRTVRVKRGQPGWFAAGAGIERSLSELSDAAFKVFVHVCLRAERASGCLEFQRQDLARAVGKSRSTLGRCLRELAGKGVCELEAAANQHGVSRLRVHPRDCGGTSLSKGPELPVQNWHRQTRREGPGVPYPEPRQGTRKRRDDDVLLSRYTHLGR